MSLQLENIDIRVNGEVHLNNICQEFEPGKLYTILGRTLSGKTTLLRTIAGLQTPDQGRLTLNGRNCLSLPVWKRGVAMVYQQFINYPHLNVLSNVTFPLLRAGMSRKEANQKARRVLDKIGLAEFEKRKPSALSGGQQQRVALARALVKDSEILLLDEPLVNLDYKLREQLRDEFSNIFQDQAENILIYTTTDPAEAIQLGHELIVMDEGAVIQRDRPLEVFNAPVNIRCAEVINDPPMNIFEGAIRDGEIRLRDGVTLPRPSHMSDLAEGEYRFGLQAMDLAVGEGFKSTVALSEISGSQTIVHLEAAIGDFIIYETGVNHYSIGEVVGVKMKVDRMYVFSTDGSLIQAPRAPLEAGR